MKQLTQYRLKQQKPFPFIEISLVFLTTVIAISYIPDTPQVKGALFWPACWLTFGLLIVPLSVAMKGTDSVLRAEYGLMLGLVYWLLMDLLQGAYPLYELSDDAIKLAFIAIAVMATGIWLGVAGKGWRPPRLIMRTARLELGEKAIFTAIVIAFVLGMMHFVVSSNFDPLVMWNGLKGSRWSTPWARGALGGWGSFMEHMRYFGYILPSLTVALAQRMGWLRIVVILSIVLSVIMLAFLAQGGARRVIGVTVGSALVCWIVLQGQLSLKQKIVSAVVLVLLLSFMQFMLKQRVSGFASELPVKVETRFKHLHVDDNFLRLGQVIQIFPRSVDYAGIEPIIYVLVRPIPRALWPGKPVSPGYNLTMLVGMSGISLSSSIVGELYAIYGLIAVLVGGVILGRLAATLNRIYTDSHGNGRALVFSIGLMILFVSLRSMQDLVIMSYGLLAWIVIASFVQRRQKLQ